VLGLARELRQGQGGGGGCGLKAKGFEEFGTGFHIERFKYI
jgi:hypothetical protein